jgi:hypothetical protein
MVIYLVLGLAAYSQRRSPFGSFWTRACVLAAACFRWFGPGQDWYGSRQNPAYYNRVMRLGSFFGRMGQLVRAAAGVLVRWVVNRLNGQGRTDGM